jgi:predicted  nucleic acid-binding Zn-ribbon protein
MTMTAAAIRELHRIHKQVSDLRERIERGPKQIRAGETGIQRFAAELAQAKEAYTKVRVAADDKQLQLKQRENRIDDLKLKLNACSSNREYQALKEQIAADEQANSVLSDEILEALENIDVWHAKVATAESNLAKANAELAKARKRVEEQQSGLESELARVTAELKHAESALPADFKSDYERVAKVKGEHALAQVEGESCGGCYQTLPPQTMNILRMSKPVFCKNCGCLLYLPEDRAAGRQ